MKSVLVSFLLVPPKVFYQVFYIQIHILPSTLCISSKKNRSVCEFDEFTFVHKSCLTHFFQICYLSCFFLLVNIVTIDWSVLTPNSSPTEHIWDLLKKAFRIRNTIVQTITELKRQNTLYEECEWFRNGDKWGQY